MATEIINPYNGKKIATFVEMQKSAINYLIDKAQEEQLLWKNQHLKYRGILMRKAAKVLLKNKEAYAHTMAMEMGKPYTEGIAEVEKCAWVCNYYADNAARFLKNKMVLSQI